MENTWNQKRLFYEVVMPFNKIIESVELNGFLIDRAKHEELRVFFTNEENRLHSDLINMVGDYNFRSSQQVCDILFNKLKFDNFIIDNKYDYKKDKWVDFESKFETEKGADSANIFVLKKLKRTTNNHPFVNKLMEYRKVCTIKSKFIDGLDEFITDKNTIHPDIWPLTKGGRLAISKPALGQLPSRTELGRMIKQIFIAPDGYFMVEEDLSAVELRGMAFVCKEATMWPAFQKGTDIHALTTSRIFNISYEEARKDKKKRYIGKTINFAIIYGGSPDSVQRTLLKDTDEFYTHQECAEFIKVFNMMYKDVARLQRSVLDYILDHQNIKNLYGRYRYFPEIKRKTSFKDYQEKRDYNSLTSAAMRQGMSHLVQSTFTGDLSAINTIKIDKLFKDKKFDGRYYFNFYDGFFSLVKEDQVEEFYKCKKEILNNPESPINMFIPSEGGWGKKWSELH